MKENRKLLLLSLALVGLFILLIVISSHASVQRNDNTKHIKELIALNSKQEKRSDKIQTQNEKLQTQLQYLISHPPKDGANGTNGANGSNGQNGSSGKNGKNGVDGASVYNLWLSLGNTGTPADFLNSLQGQDGTSPPEVELHCNPVKLQNEWRYVGTSAWHALDKVLQCA